MGRPEGGKEGAGREGARREGWEGQARTLGLMDLTARIGKGVNLVERKETAGMVAADLGAAADLVAAADLEEVVWWLKGILRNC